MKHYKNKVRKIVILMTFFVLCFSITSSAASLNKKKTTMMVGKSQTLKLKGASGKITWKSSNPSVVKVNSAGKIKALKKGTARIKAIVKKKTYTCKVTVKQPVKSIRLNKKKYSMTVGNKVKLHASVSPGNANNKAVVWSSSNNKIAKVDKKGVVTAYKSGTAVIKAKAADGSGKKASCTIVVSDNSSKDSSNGNSDNSNNSNNGNSNAANDNYDNSNNGNNSNNNDNAGITDSLKNDTSDENDSSAAKETEQTDSLEENTTNKESAENPSEEQAVPILKPSMKAVNFLKCLEKFNYYVEKNVKDGIPWFYQNGNESKTFAEAVRDQNLKTNCALLVVWALKEESVNVYDYNDKFWGTSYGMIHYGGKNPAASEAHLKANADIIQINEEQGMAFAEGKLIPGDICIYNMGEVFHTNVFAGNISGTNRLLWYDAGRNGVGGFYKDGRYYFSKFGPIEINGSRIISQIIRLK